VHGHITFLIDENLSPELAKLARAQGFRASHVAWVRLAGKPDYQVAAFAVSRDLILVTNDIDDLESSTGKESTIPALSSCRLRMRISWTERLSASCSKRA
jgi:predicted nuclease of predicted toxin-antitoxin system